MNYGQKNIQSLITLVTFLVSVVVLGQTTQTPATALKLIFTPKLILDNSKIESLQLVDKEALQKSLQKPQGPRTGGGGNSCSLAIRQNSERLRSLINDMPDLLARESINKVFAIIATARFFIGDTLVINGQSKDAINYPVENRIIVTQRLCERELVEVSGRAMSLLLHEYLGLASIEDRDYRISGSFLEKYAEILRTTPRIQSSSVSDPLLRAAMTKFLREANDPRTATGKRVRDVLSENEFPLAKDSMQITIEESTERLRPWRNHERIGNSCTVEGDSASLNVALSYTKSFGPTLLHKNIVFKLDVQEILKVIFSAPSRPGMDCQSLVIQDDTPGKSKNSVQVSDIKEVSIPE